MVFRDTLRKIYSDYDVYIRPVLRFLFALLCLLSINSYIGYMPVLQKGAVVLLGALFCSVMPLGTVSFVSAVFIIGNMAQLSLVTAAFMFAIMAAIGLLYLGFKPRGGWLMVLVPLCFMWKMPFLVPVLLGLSAGAASVVPAVCAIPVWFTIRFFHDHAAEFKNSTDFAEITSEFVNILNGVLKDKYMYLMIVMFVVCILLVSVLKRLSINHAWTIAIGAGLLAEFLIGIVGGQMIGGGDLMWDIIGIAGSLLLALLYEYLFFGVDYSGTEKLQFEDDDYYYYVKAVPKIKPYNEDERRE